MSAHLRSLLKSLANGVALAVASPLAALTWAERLATRDRGRELFVLCGQALALAPGTPGKFLRRAYYRLTLARCSATCDIGFLTHLSDPRTEIGDRVYIGPSVALGYVQLGEGCMIGTRASIINGGQQHRHDAHGRLTPFDSRTAARVLIGAHTWIGEGAILMADTGCACIIGAGSVVSQPVPDHCLVAGNPARFVRRLDAASIETPPSPAHSTLERAT